jgi:hypothetical protein
MFLVGPLLHSLKESGQGKAYAIRGESEDRTFRD